MTRLTNIEKRARENNGARYLPINHQGAATMTTTTPKRPPIPNTLKPSREGDEIMVTIPHYWGRAATLSQAKAKVKQASGQPYSEWKAWRVYSVHPSTYLQEMGYINHPEDHPPVVLAEHNPSS